MSIARPLYVHPDLRGKGLGAHFYYKPEENKIGFSKGTFQEAPPFFLPVNENSNRPYLAHELEIIADALQKRLEHSGLTSKLNIIFTEDGAEASLDGLLRNVDKQEKGKIILENLNRTRGQIESSLEKSSLPENCASYLAATTYMECLQDFSEDSYDEPDVEPIYMNGLIWWPQNTNADVVINSLALHAAQNGIDLDKDELKLAVFARIDELLAEGRELSLEQNEFWEEMRESNEVQRLDIMSPMRSRPKPGKAW